MSTHLALLDMKEYQGEVHFKRFDFMAIPIKSGHALVNKEEGFNVEYIRKVRELMNPNEYALELEDCVDEIKNEEGCYEDIINKHYLLFLKKGEDVVVIAPKVEFEKDSITCDFFDIFKEVASSVCVL